MATIVVRDVPDELHEKLKAMADGQHRSLNGQVLHILKNVAEGAEWLDSLRRYQH